jgi:hypothetical protein
VFISSPGLSVFGWPFARHASLVPSRVSKRMI